MTSTTNVLETLHAARDRLTGDAPFDFMDWPSCTCGHIYAAANDGQTATTYNAVNGYRDYQLAPDGHFVYTPGGDFARTTPDAPQAYKDAIIAAARALGWDGGVTYGGWTDWGYAAMYVSNMTQALTDGDPDKVKREHALAVIDDAIAKIEAEQERDRQRVLADAAASRTRAGLPGPSRTITVEPLELPHPEPTPLPEKAPAEPAPERAPAEPDKVPAGA